MFLIGRLFKVKHVIANDVNNTNAVEIAIESITTATVNNSSPADLKEATETLVRLADARARVENVIVSENEISVRPSVFVSLSLAYLKFLLAFLFPPPSLIFFTHFYFYCSFFSFAFFKLFLWLPQLLHFIVYFLYNTGFMYLLLSKLASPVVPVVITLLRTHTSIFPILYNTNHPSMQLHKLEMSKNSRFDTVLKSICIEIAYSRIIVLL